MQVCRTGRLFPRLSSSRPRLGQLYVTCASFSPKSRRRRVQEACNPAHDVPPDQTSHPRLILRNISELELTQPLPLCQVGRLLERPPHRRVRREVSDLRVDASESVAEDVRVDARVGVVGRSGVLRVDQTEVEERRLAVVDVGTDISTSKSDRRQQMHPDDNGR